MKEIIRLTEADLHRIVKESVDKIINETSDDKVYDAYYKARKKVADAERHYGSDSKVAQKARNQMNNFYDEYISRYNASNDAKKARMEKNATDYMWGDRKYKDGKWKTKKMGLFRRLFDA